ncbi:putative DNA-binding transcriptional regulator [Kitasatospora sp. GP30]|uniref:helix-turn-helix domain-containing protein n=1 Tax=Kitasatospora sp. GP30 TaxID=3035084 RepID=UPI000CAC94F8|nr:helix-turn-helix transcriptional regulator [Kitasatospora sp. GP30]MDH6139926.1 putative DNA-binding transcriptional regulator [Kitasatospora sp. GP30]
MDASDAPGPARLPSLGTGGLLVYTHAVQREAVSVTELSGRAGLPERSVRDGIAELLGLGLLEAVPGASDRYRVIPPQTARDLLLGPVVREIDQLRDEVDRVRAEFDGLLPLYESRTDRVRPVVRLPGPESLRRSAAELGSQARSEVLLCRPAVLLGTADTAWPLPWVSQLLAREAEMRVLYPYAARFTPAAGALAEQLTPLGAVVRTLPNALPEFAVFDQRAALIPHQDPAIGGLLVRDPTLVAFLADLFDRDWGLATPFDGGVSRPELSEVTEELKVTILRALIAGGKDREIAQQLGISERTCQRHIADILDRLGARTRMQAGYLAHQRGIR